MSWWRDRDDPAFADLLPHGLVLEEGVVLLSTPRPRQATLALGVAWAVEPRNVEVSADATCLHIARVLDGLLVGLPEGSALQVLMQIRPAHAVPAWAALRQRATAPAVPFQRQAIAEGLCHRDGATIAGRLRTVATHVTLRLPVPALAPTLVQRLRIVCTLTEAAPARLTARLQTTLATALTRLRSLRAAVEDALGTAGIAWQRLDAAGVGAALARALAPLADAPPVLHPNSPLRSQVLTTPGTPEAGGWQFGGLTARVLSLRAAPGRPFRAYSPVRGRPGTRRPWPCGRPGPAGRSPWR